MYKCGNPISERQEQGIAVQVSDACACMFVSTFDGLELNYGLQYIWGIQGGLCGVLITPSKISQSVRS